jgi:hypothetical protein
MGGRKAGRAGKVAEVITNKGKNKCDDKSGTCGPLAQNESVDFFGAKSSW